MSTPKESGCSQREFHVSQAAEPGGKWARQTTAGSGRRLLPFVRSSGPVGSCLKILLESTTWASAESFLNWEGSATKSGWPLYRLVPSIRRRTGSDTGLSPDLWPTAQERDHKGVTQRYSKGDLSATPNAMKAALWPTVIASSGGPVKHETAKSGGNRSMSRLKAALWPGARSEDSQCAGAHRGYPDSVYSSLKVSLWPTATSSEQSNRTRKIAPSHGKTHGFVLPGLLGTALNGSSALTAEAATPFAAFQLVFTAWLMGYPLEYLENFGPKLSPHSETPSSGKSRRKS